MAVPVLLILDKLLTYLLNYLLITGFLLLPTQKKEGRYFEGPMLDIGTATSPKLRQVSVFILFCSTSSDIFDHIWCKFRSVRLVLRSFSHFTAMQTFKHNFQKNVQGKDFLTQ